MTRWLVTAVVLAAPLASAQTSSPVFDLDRFELSATGTGALAASNALLLPKGGWRATALLQYQSQPLVAFNTTGRLGAVVAHRTGVQLAAAYAPFERWDLAILLPFVLWQSGDDLSGMGIQSPATVGAGMPAVTARYAILAPDPARPFHLAAQASLMIPLGSTAALASDLAPRFAPRIVGSYVQQKLVASAELGATFRGGVGAGTAAGSNAVGSDLIGSVSAALQLNQFRPEIAFRGALSLTGMPPAYELLLGGRYLAKPRLEFFALAGPGYGAAAGQPRFRFLTGVSWIPGAPSAKRTAPLAAAPEADPNADFDADGVPDGRDACPTDAGNDERGCPAGAAADKVADQLGN